MSRKTLFLIIGNIALFLVTTSLAVAVFKDVVITSVTKPSFPETDKEVVVPTQPSPIPLVDLYASFKITPETVTLRKGQTQIFTITLETVDAANSIGAADIVLAYEPLDLEIDLQSIELIGSQYQIIKVSPGEMPGELTVSIGAELGAQPSEAQEPFGFSISAKALRSTDNYPTMLAIDTKSTVASKNGAMVTAPSAATVTIQD
ncbi:hypothetical protein KA012_00540 [Candidatus Woesebacteria bacterium]|nr:hypothetical protein [Candidatus Woesebacteria bacterium]